MNFKLKHNNTKFIISTDIEKYIWNDTDILVNYCLPSLIEGDEIFAEIHKQGGSTIYQNSLKALVILSKSLQQTLNEMPNGETFYSNKGLLKCNKLLHFVLPDKRITPTETLQNLPFQTLQNIFILIEESKNSTNPMNSLTLRPFPKTLLNFNNNDFIERFIKTIVKNSNCLEEIRIVCHDEKEFKKVKSELLKQTQSFYERLLIQFGL
jgi:hypothetical protein